MFYLCPTPAAAQDSLLIWERIDRNTVEKVEAFVRRPEAHRLRLNSMGGDIAAAIWIARRVRARGLVTAVGKNAVCASMCVLVYMAGVARAAHASALFGFHRAWNRADGRALGDAADRRILERMARYGLEKPESLYKRVVALDRHEWLILPAPAFARLGGVTRLGGAGKSK